MDENDHNNMWRWSYKINTNNLNFSRADLDRLLKDLYGSSESDDPIDTELEAMDLLESDVDITIEPARQMLASIGIKC
jgi:hypothetical protein